MVFLFFFFQHCQIFVHFLSTQVPLRAVPSICQRLLLVHRAYAGTETSVGDVILATLKKKFVSCVAGGLNYGHSGGRKFFFFPFFFFSVRKLLKCLEKQKKNRKLKKKSSQSAQIFLPGRWTGNKLFFKGGLSDIVSGI